MSNKTAADTRRSSPTPCSKLKAEIRKKAVGAAILDVWDDLKKHDLNYYQSIQVLALTLHQIRKNTGDDAMLHLERMWDRLNSQNVERMNGERPKTSTEEKNGNKT